MLDFDALPSVPYLVDLRLHLVKVALQSQLALLVREFDLFEAPRQLFLFFFLGQVSLIHPFGLLRSSRQIFKVDVQLFQFRLYVLKFLV